MGQRGEARGRTEGEGSRGEKRAGRGGGGGAEAGERRASGGCGPG